MDGPRLDGALAGVGVIVVIAALAGFAQLFGDVATLGLLVTVSTFAAAATRAPFWMVAVGPGLAAIVAALSLAKPHVLLGHVLAIFSATVLAAISGLGIAAWRGPARQGSQVAGHVSRKGRAGEKTQPPRSS